MTPTQLSSLLLLPLACLVSRCPLSTCSLWFSAVSRPAIAAVWPCTPGARSPHTLRPIPSQALCCVCTAPMVALLPLDIISLVKIVFVVFFLLFLHNTLWKTNILNGYTVFHGVTSCLIFQSPAFCHRGQPCGLCSVLFCSHQQK